MYTICLFVIIIVLIFVILNYNNNVKLDNKIKQEIIKLNNEIK